MDVIQKLKLKLISPEETLFAQEVNAVVIPTENGEITVLPQHAGLVSILVPGELIVQDGKTRYPLAVAGGVIQVQDNNVTILTDAAVHAKDIDLATAEKRANELAKQLEDQATLNLADYQTLLRNLEHEKAKLRVGRKWHN
ncbi:MAG: ATP synthase F1 subunit epsilon [Candidatus Kerfeldbacteria bacterium RIFOXYC2_FULL_38_9]|nr:MAG: ATP synthase F1 subunit epsilon [Candidatus Kerfeldbacteria bacterium RIFOXYC2_FULL_38_9]